MEQSPERLTPTLRSGTNPSLVFYYISFAMIILSFLFNVLLTNVQDQRQDPTMERPWFFGGHAKTLLNEMPHASLFLRFALLFPSSPITVTRRKS